MSEPTLPSTESSPPTSPFMASSLAPPSSATEHYDEADESPQSEKKKKKTGALKYPEGIPRLTKLGRCTYGLNTGPLPDGTDWSKLSVAIIKEQLNMRNIPTDGRKPILIERLTNWKTFLPERTEVRPSQSDFGHIDRFSNAEGEKRKWVDQTESKYANAIKKAMKDTMFIVQKIDTSNFGEERVTFKVQSSSLYNVTIGKRTDCDCMSAVSCCPRSSNVDAADFSQTYNKISNCKHVICKLCVNLEDIMTDASQMCSLTCFGPRLRYSLRRLSLPRS